jgi:hypothetical protein
MNIQVDPELVPAIQSVYTQDVAEKMGHLRPNERVQFEAALKAVDEEEARMARVFAAGKITEGVRDSLWREWQDRRNQLRLTLEAMGHQHKTHISNLDSALEMIAQVGVVYNILERGDQKELLRHIVERVVIDKEGKIRLELRAPFSYLKDISDQVQTSSMVNGVKDSRKKKTGILNVAGFSEAECSNQLLCCGEDRIRTCDTRLPTYNRLAGGPIRPLWHLPNVRL